MLIACTHVLPRLGEDTPAEPIRRAEHERTSKAQTIRRDYVGFGLPLTFGEAVPPVPASDVLFPVALCVLSVCRI